VDAVGGDVDGLADGAVVASGNVVGPLEGVVVAELEQPAIRASAARPATIGSARLIIASNGLGLAG
ncbi:MAG: hypothetical protein JWN39_4335, partial [Ilumatobacteraceae bacterium]|nr:hypothetical protein [Ilumatobacteraceae bacterium]